METDRSSKRIALFPREHGASAQLAVSLAAGLALGHGGRRPFAQAMLTLSLFFLSEPTMILLGRRGDSLRKTMGMRAGRRALALMAMAVMAAFIAWNPASPRDLSYLILPGLLALMLFGLCLLHKEHTPTGELTAAWTMASAGLPVGHLGGASSRSIWILTLGLGLVLSLGTLLVRAHLRAMKNRNPSPRLAMVIFALTTQILAALGAKTSSYPWLTSLAPVPMTILAISVWWYPPAPRRMKAIGWYLALGSIIGAVLLVLGLRR